MCPRPPRPLHRDEGKTTKRGRKMKELLDKIGELLDRSTTIGRAEKAVLLCSIARLIEEWARGIARPRET